MTTRKQRTWVKMFQMGFVPKVRSGAKPTTIRPRPTRPQDWPKPGDLIDARHWFGKPYRSSQVKIITARITKVQWIKITADKLMLGESQDCLEVAWDGSHRTGHEMLEAIAKRDGFGSWAAMVNS